MSVKVIPKGFKELRANLMRHLGATSVEYERLTGSNRYRVMVLSPKFKGVPHLKRQDRIWKLVDATLSPEASLKISLIFAFAPHELEK